MPTTRSHVNSGILTVVKASTLESTELATTDTPKRGRPSTYTEAIGESICESLSEGIPLTEILRSVGMPSYNTVKKWIDEDSRAPGFGTLYARARRLQLEVLSDQILEISDDGTNDYMERQLPDGGVTLVPNSEMVARSRLRVDSRKWLLSKLRPELYGDQIKVEHTGTVGVLSVAEILRQREDAVKAQAEAALTIDTSAEVQG